MGTRTFNQCLSIAVITILLLLTAHVILVFWIQYRNASDQIVDVDVTTYVKNHQASGRKYHHERRKSETSKSDAQIPSDIKLLDLNCTTTANGGLNCGNTYDWDKASDTSSSIQIFNDEVHYLYLNCVCNCILSSLLLFTILSL